MKVGAVAPRESHENPTLRRGETNEYLCVKFCRVSITYTDSYTTYCTSRDFSTVKGQCLIISKKRQHHSTRFSTVRSEVRSGAIRVDITNPQQWSAGDIAVIRNQEAKKVRDIGSLIFETPIQHDYEAEVEVRSLLPTEQLEETDGRLAVLDTDPNTGNRFVRFWVDELPFNADRRKFCAT